MVKFLQGVVEGMKIGSREDDEPNSELDCGPNQTCEACIKGKQAKSYIVLAAS